MKLPFRDRRDAGRQLAGLLKGYKKQPRTIVLALPRGGVPVGYEVAKALEVPLDIFLVRKLGVPGHEELAMGAIASGGIRILNDDVIQDRHISEETVEAVTIEETRELERREQLYRGVKLPVGVAERTVILVDDGLATGSTMRAAASALRREKLQELIIGVPVAAPAVCTSLNDVADQVICAVTPEPFHAVGLWYEDFSPTQDDEVRELLHWAEQQGI